MMLRNLKNFDSYFQKNCRSDKLTNSSNEEDKKNEKEAPQELREIFTEH